MSNVVLMTLSVASALIPSIHRRPPLAVRMKILAQKIHAQVRHLVEQGTERLVPRDDDPETARLELFVVGELAIIDRFGYGDELIRKVARTFVIRPDVVVERHITGYGLLPSDREWCHNKLTERRLEYLLLVLQDEAVYSPRRKVIRSL